MLSNGLETMGFGISYLALDRCLGSISQTFMLFLIGNKQFILKNINV